MSIAYKMTSAFGGIEILHIDERNGHVYWRYSKEAKEHKSQLYYSATQGKYFKINGKREYLYEFIRTYGFPAF